jgi:hypothetical protein
MFDQASDTPCFRAISNALLATALSSVATANQMKSGPPYCSWLRTEIRTAPSPLLNWFEAAIVRGSLAASGMASAASIITQNQNNVFITIFGLL